MNIKRAFAFLKSGTKAKPPVPMPPDPAIEFQHPENAALFGWMKENAKMVDPETYHGYARGGYEVRAHSDLTPILYGLITDTAVRKGYAYGRPVIATSKGLIFGYAGGTHYIFFKLRKDQFDDAQKDGGRFDPTYGDDWIEFAVAPRWGVAVDWHQAMERWANTSYQNSLSVE
jgi:hypothetical protein